MNQSGDHKLFIYNNSIDLVVTTDGIYLDNRPMNLRRLVAHRGLTNEILFIIRDRDRKLQNVFAEQLRAYITEPVSKRRILTKLLENTSDIGKVKLTLTAADLQGLNAGLYHVYITRTNAENTSLPLYNDQDNNIRFDIEITNQTGDEPITTQDVTNLTAAQQGSNVLVSDAMVGNLDENFSNAQHTIAIYTTAFTGNLTVQGSCLANTPDTAASSLDWFNIVTLPVQDFTGIVNNTFQVNTNWVRVIVTPDTETGAVTRILLRN